MKANFCQSAGKARNCGDCKHNPMNQQGQGVGQRIEPRIPVSLKCPFWKSVDSR